MGRRIVGQAYHIVPGSFFQHLHTSYKADIIAAAGSPSTHGARHGPLHRYVVLKTLVPKGAPQTPTYYHCRYTNNASLALSENDADPSDTSLVSKVSTPPMAHVPSLKVWPPNVKTAPLSCLASALGAVSLFALTEEPFNPVRIKDSEVLEPEPLK